MAFLLCATVLGATHIFSPRMDRLAGSDLEELLAFWAGANLFLVVWTLIGVGMVSRRRFHSADDINGSAYARPSPRIAVAAVLSSNTLEQFVVATFSLFALVMLLGVAAMPLVTVSALLVGIGRITFLLGCAFGMVITPIPTTVAFLLAIGALEFSPG